MSSPRLSEARQDILNSAAFRLTLRFAGIFIACLLVLGLGLGLTARWVVEHEAKGQIEEELGELRDAFDRGGAAALAGSIAERVGKGYRDLINTLAIGQLGYPLDPGGPEIASLPLRKIGCQERTGPEAGLALAVEAGHRPQARRVHGGARQEPVTFNGGLERAPTTPDLPAQFPG